MNKFSSFCSLSAAVPADVILLGFGAGLDIINSSTADSPGRCRLDYSTSAKFGNTALNTYFYIVKSKSKKAPKADHSLREQILKSMMASFKIEGINIPIDAALATLKKVELSLGK